MLQSDDNKNKSKKENKNLEKDVDTDIHLSLENSYSLKEESGGAACAGAAGAAPAPPASSSSSSFLDKIRELNGKKKKNRLTEAGLAAFAAETKEGVELWGKPIEGGLSKALNGWAKKTAENGKHPEYFDDGTGQNAAAPDGAGQDHAGQDGTSAGPGKAAPDQGGGNQAASTTTAQDEAKEKALKARIAELTKECRRIEAAPREKVRGLCPYEDAGNCRDCRAKEDCKDEFLDNVRGKVSKLAWTIMGGDWAIQFFCPISIITPDELKEYAANCEHVYFPKAGTIVLDDPYYKLDQILDVWEWGDDEDAKELEKYYSDKPFHGIPEAIARHELNMPLPHEANLIKRAEEEQEQERAVLEIIKK